MAFVIIVPKSWGGFFLARNPADLITYRINSRAGGFDHLMGVLLPS